jgi:hypothetical protein
VRVDGALIAVSHDQTFLEGIGVERGDDSLTKRSAVKVSFGSKPEKLNASKCFPLFTQQRTLRNAVGMSVYARRHLAVMAAIFIGALLATEHFGKRLPKPK